MLSVEPVGAEEFAHLRSEWNALLERSGSDSPFLRHEWLASLCGTVCPSSSALILRLHCGKETIGFAPLQWKPYRRGPFRFRRLHFLGAQLTEFADCILTGYRSEALQALVDFLGQHHWLEFVGHYIAEGSPNWHAYQALVCSIPGARLHPYTSGWYIRIAGRSWEEYVAEETGREFVQRAIRRRQALYGQRHWGLCERHGLDAQELAHLLRLHELAQQRHGRSSVFAHSDAHRAFLERLVQESSAAGWLRLFWLHIDGAPASFILGFEYRGSFFWWLQGFDPAFEQLAPSKWLLWHLLQDAFAKQRWREFHFMGGDDEYKRHWTRSSFRFYRLRIPNTRGVMGWLNRWLSRH